MSFINLMGSDRWPDADIVRRCEAIIASENPRAEILQRKVLGAVLGQYALTAAEQAELQGFAMVALEAGNLADQMRTVAARLHAAMDVEDAQAALARIPDDDEHTAERATHQAVINAASQDTMDLVAERAAHFAPPPPPPEPELQSV